MTRLMSVFQATEMSVLPGILLVLQLCAFWPVWVWYTLRMAQASEEWCGLLALATALCFIVQKKVHHRWQNSQWLIPACLIVFYALTYPFLLPLLRAGLAMTALAATFSIYAFGTSFHPGLWGLLLLSLPVIPSLQFYLGYPLRVLVAIVAVPLLRLGGFGVVREGTCLNWGGTLIWIDAPCSGVRMLWAGLFLAFTLACFNRLTRFQTCLAVACSVIMILLGNVLRASALFYSEAEIIHLPSWSHDGIGVVVFLFTVIGIMWLVHEIRRRFRCVSSPSM